MAQPPSGGSPKPPSLIDEVVGAGTTITKSIPGPLGTLSTQVLQSAGQTLDNTLSPGSSSSGSSSSGAGGALGAAANGATSALGAATSGVASGAGQLVSGITSQ